MVNARSSAPTPEALPNNTRQGRVSSDVSGQDCGFPRRRPGHRMEALHVAFRRGMHAGILPGGLRGPGATSLRVVA